MDPEENAPPPKPVVMLTGATGYVGGRLRERLERLGFPLHCLVRSPSNIPLSYPPSTHYFVGDVSDKKIVLKALEGVDVAFYLIHSMSSPDDFSETDRQLASIFAKAAARSNVKRIIYLGGLGSNYEEELSPHLKSRHEVGQILRANSDETQVIEFRASIVIGSGSLSFEMIRALVERLPVMITPSWVSTPAQPIGIEDLLHYLIDAIQIDFGGDPIFEIGGKDKVSYGSLMQEYARQRGLKRWMIPVPVLTPRLSSLWLGLVTPLYARVGRKLVESALCPTTVHDPLATHLFKFQPMGIKEAIHQALQNENNPAPPTRWNDPVSASISNRDWGSARFGKRLIDCKEAEVNASPEEAFKPIERIGGKTGYYYANWLWTLRGSLDLLFGGVGTRRGRRDPQQVRAGDVIDFWRVETCNPPHYLKLTAEMKVPGRASLEFRVDPLPHGSKITQTALFDPIGITGILYWYLLYPIHHFVFTGMLRGLIKQIKERR